MKSKKLKHRKTKKNKNKKTKKTRYGGGPVRGRIVGTIATAAVNEVSRTFASGINSFTRKPRSIPEPVSGYTVESPTESIPSQELVVPTKENGFSVVNYNILAKSLGSACIPWLINLSEEFKLEINEELKKNKIFMAELDTHNSSNKQLTPFDFLIHRLKLDYMKYFHKNPESGDKNKMRELWGATIKTQYNIPPELSGVGFVKEDTINVPIKLKTGETEMHVVRTLRGLLKDNFRIDADHYNVIAARIFDELMNTEQFRRWSSRGPLIFRTLMEKNPDIIVLTEYDVHMVEANYLNKPQTFKDAMQESGYQGILFTGVSDVEGGIGIWWKTDVFTCPVEVDTVPCGRSTPVYKNMDFHEEFHLSPTGPTSVMKDADRRHACCVLLEHTFSGKQVLVTGSHLMTESRDNKTTTAYPGEVRAFELMKWRDMVTEFTSGMNPSLIVTGDFNINLIPVAPETYILTGKILEPPIDTGFTEDETGVVGTWGTYTLTEAFANKHQWVKGVGKGKYCSSYTNGRCTWIDMLWKSQDLVVVGQSDNTTPVEFIPDEWHGSDHLPLYAEFKWTSE